jgi:hypothetical protein
MGTASVGGLAMDWAARDGGRGQGSLFLSRCAGPRQIVGAVTEPHAVRRLLAALGLAAEPPPGRPATPPPDPRLVAPPPRRRRPRLFVGSGEGAGPSRADLRPPLPLPTVPRYGASGDRGGPGRRGAGKGAGVTGPRNVPSASYVLYQLRRPWRDGSTALLLDPVELAIPTFPCRKSSISWSPPRVWSPATRTRWRASPSTST